MSSLSLTAARGMRSLLFMAVAWAGIARAVDINLCASFNTASMAQNVSVFQTNGLCHDFCLPAGYVYAITQSNGCWCSNYSPEKSTQVDTSECNLSCPGYPSEKCGANGLYGYIFLNAGNPSGTKGPSPTPSSTGSTTGTTTAATTSLLTVTADGTVKTVTVLPTETGHATGDNQHISVQKDGLSTGAIVGIVIGIVGGVLLLAGLALYFYFRRKRHQQEDDYQSDPSVRGSSSVMVGSSHPEMSRVTGSQDSTGNRSSTLQVDPRMDPFQQSLYARGGSRESINTLRDEHDYSRRIQAPKVLRATNPDPDVD